jgi:CRP-like cAMP-binding protein
MKLHQKQQLTAQESGLKRFEGSEGRLHLMDALKFQPLVRDEDLAVEVAPLLKLEEVSAGTKIIEQGTTDTDFFLILSGTFSVAINRRVVAQLKAGTHVGEMAVVDPTTPRSASVTATCDSVVARIPEPDFSRLANRFPRLWRRIALELASRLRNGNSARRGHGKSRRAAWSSSSCHCSDRNSSIFPAGDSRREAGDELVEKDITDIKKNLVSAQPFALHRSKIAATPATSRIRAKARVVLPLFTISSLPKCAAWCRGLQAWQLARRWQFEL